MPVDTAQDVPFGHMAREMSRMLDRMSKNYSNFFPGEAWHPNVNLYETEGAYMVCVDLAGVDKDTIDLHVVEHRLVLRGRREVPCCSEDIQNENSGRAKAKIHLMEIDHGPFVREVELPANVQDDKINAAYRHGLLWVELPKRVGSGQ
ncbi:MAG: Hsp20/alpha crystallin family protein [Tepidisphaeraceae bacterium]